MYFFVKYSATVQNLYSLKDYSILTMKLKKKLYIKTQKASSIKIESAVEPSKISKINFYNTTTICCSVSVELKGFVAICFFFPEL